MGSRQLTLAQLARHSEAPTESIMQVASFTRTFLISFSLTFTHPVPVLWPPGSSLSSLNSHSHSLSPSSPHRISVTSKSNLRTTPVGGQHTNTTLRLMSSFVDLTSRDGGKAASALLVMNKYLCAVGQWMV